MKEIRERIKLSPKAARVNSGLRQVEAAKIIGITVYKLVQIEHGMKIKEKEKEKIQNAMCQAYKLSIDDIAFA